MWKCSHWLISVLTVEMQGGWCRSLTSGQCQWTVANLELWFLYKSPEFVYVRVCGRRVDDAAEHIFTHVLGIIADRCQHRLPHRHLYYLRQKQNTLVVNKTHTLQKYNFLFLISKLNNNLYLRYLRALFESFMCRNFNMFRVIEVTSVLSNVCTCWCR